MYISARTTITDLDPQFWGATTFAKGSFDAKIMSANCGTKWLLHGIALIYCITCTYTIFSSGFVFSFQVWFESDYWPLMFESSLTRTPLYADSFN